MPSEQQLTAAIRDTLRATVRLDVRIKNPLNSMSQTRRGALARAAERKKLRRFAFDQSRLLLT